MQVKIKKIELFISQKIEKWLAIALASAMARRHRNQTSLFLEEMERSKRCVTK